MMKIKMQVVIESDEGAAEIVEHVIHIKRGTLCPEDLGMRYGTDSYNITQH